MGVMVGVKVGGGVLVGVAVFAGVAVLAEVGMAVAGGSAAEQLLSSSEISSAPPMNPARICQLDALPGGGTGSGTAMLVYKGVVFIKSIPQFSKKKLI
jgi:hypothetical protein